MPQRHPWNCRAAAQDKQEFDNLHRFVNNHLANAAEANSEGTFPSITWTDGDVPLSVSYHLIPHDSRKDGCGSSR